MNQIQEKLYELLIEVDDICKKHDIIYYLAAGGALGAVRGGGFLPWDDDLDLYITRDNWERLKNVMEKELPDNREFVCVENTELYCNPIGRYVDKETTLMMQSQLLCGKCCGLLVEFFIMDPMPIEPQQKWMHREYMKTYTEILSPYFLLNREILEHNTDFNYKLYNKYYWLSKLIGEKRTLNLLLKKFAQFPEEKCDEFCMRWGTRTVKYPSEVFGTPKMVSFEGREFPLVEDPERSFRIGYGDDWMYVPEGEGKIAHNLSNDLEEPFKTYTDIYMPLLNKDKLLKAFKKRKRVAIKNIRKRELYEREYAMLHANKEAKNILNELGDIEILKTLLEKQKFELINIELENFYQIQANELLKKNDILIPLPDEYIYIAMMNYILQGYYYKAAKLMAYREKLNRELSTDLDDVKKAIEFCRELSIAIYDEKDTKKVQRLLKDNIKYSHMLDFKRAKLWLLHQKASNADDYNDLIQEAQNAIDCYGNDGELIRFKAYGLYKLGNQQAAMEKYCDAIRNTRNGFVWKEANDLMNLDAYAIADDNLDIEEDEFNGKE